MCDLKRALLPSFIGTVLSVTPSTAMRYQQSDPDVRLMLRVRDDDAGAFEELVRRYQDRLVRLFHHIGPSPELAEDLAQDVFLRVYRSRARYEAGAKFSTWLFTIAGNVARNAARSQGRRREVTEVDARKSTDDSRSNLIAGIALDASALMPTRVVEGEERAEVVRAAVQSLGERQRMALMLSRFENMSYVEIAEAMGLTTKAVKSLLSRARVNLKELLADYIVGGEAASTSAVEEFEEHNESR
jgi:RNA polymerase sigma-70 factor (ECF subfamily)